MKLKPSAVRLEDASHPSRTQTHDLCITGRTRRHQPRFRWGTDVDVALQTIAEQIDRVRLKEGVEKPLILRYDPTLEPVAQVGLFGDAPLTDLWVHAEEVVRRRLDIDGVASARPRGGLEPQVHVEVDTGAMTLRGLDMLK